MSSRFEHCYGLRGAHPIQTSSLGRYSVGYFYQPDMTLDEAQLAKMEMIGRKLDLKPGILDKILDKSGFPACWEKNPLIQFVNLAAMLRFGCVHSRAKRQNGTFPANGFHPVKQRMFFFHEIADLPTSNQPNICQDSIFTYLYWVYSLRYEAFGDWFWFWQLGPFFGHQVRCPDHGSDIVQSTDGILDPNEGWWISTVLKGVSELR